MLFTKYLLTLSPLFAFLVITEAAPEAIPRDGSGPIVKLPYGSFQGKLAGKLVQFLGMPFAAPPTGQRRFGLPEPPLHFDGIRQATSFGAPCPQQPFQFPPYFPYPFPSLQANISENCLFINVIRPADIPWDKPLPVLVYIYGGGFLVGDSSMTPVDSVVDRSLVLNKPIIFVSFNYRVNAFGFLGGKEVKDAGIANAGLHDQRFALEWIQEHIGAFGGNPGKVTIWGESAGAISIGLQMLFNEGETHGLFTGAIMESGSPMPLPNVLHQQKNFDFIANATNCSYAANKLECLRGVSFATLIDVIFPGTSVNQSAELTWTPVVDGKLIPGNPITLIESGKYAKVPFITGVCEDEGTLFAFSQLNVTTNDQFLQLVKTYYFPNISDSKLQALVRAYPDDITQGSPFNSGTANALTPQFKRIAALLGDLIFQAPRRFFLKIASKTQPTYSYRYMRDASLPYIGSGHAIEVPYFFGLNNTNDDFIALDSIIYFSVKHNPNAPANSISLLRNTHWPKWSTSTENPPLLTFTDPPPSVTITSDTYRREGLELLIELGKQ